MRRRDMLGLKEYLELLDYRADSACVVSVYLDYDRPSSCARNFRALLKERTARDPVLAGLKPDLDRLRSWIEDEFRPDRHRGLAAFSDRAHGLWVATPLPEPYKSRLQAGDRPYLAPLINVLEQYRRFGVLLVDADAARFLEVHLGDVAELAAPSGPPLAPAAAPGRSDELQAHLRGAAARLMDLARRRGYDRVVLGAPAKLTPLIAGHLHTWVSENLIVDPSLGPRSAAEEVLDRVLAGERESRKVRESVLVFRLLDAVREGGLGVTGLDETLRSVQRGLARKVLVRDGFAKMGRVCTGCGTLSLEGKRCPACYLPTEAVFNVVAELEQLALDQGCEVVRVLYDTRLDNAGAIGAELRLRPEGEPASPPPAARSGRS